MLLPHVHMYRIRGSVSFDTGDLSGIRFDPNSPLLVQWERCCLGESPPHEAKHVYLFLFCAFQLLYANFKLVIYLVTLT